MTTMATSPAAILSTTWEVLGPFPIGTREQDFGADSLEAYGGFANLRYSLDDRYPSELAEGGYVSWHEVEAVDGQIGPIDYPGISWKANTVPFGWSIEQFQSWARTALTVIRPTTCLFQVLGAAEFYVDNQRYSGDAYSYDTTYHAISLNAGKHTVIIRIVHDVRVFGGGKPFPEAAVKVMMKEPAKETIEKGVQIARRQGNTVDDVLFPSFLAHRGFAGKFGSVSLLNIASESANVFDIDIRIMNEATCQVYETVSSLVSPEPIIIASGHTRPISFSFELTDTPSIRKGTKLRMELFVKVLKGNVQHVLQTVRTVESIHWCEKTFQFTFLDFDGTCQYVIHETNPWAEAMAKRPRRLNSDRNKPIILALHGAGVEASEFFWTSSIKQQEYVWIVFPTGRTPWGYDWHGPSMKNAFKSIEGLINLEEMLSTTYALKDEDKSWVNGICSITRVTSSCHAEANDAYDWVIGDPDRLIYIGHSNGGQGTWYLGTHFPDKAIAAVPAAGYIKIQDYVSYANWIGQSHTDPLLRGVLECAIAEYNNDLHISNMAGIPVFPRMGGSDDNVPPIHTRKFNRLLNENANDANAVRLSEVPGQGHWWSQVLSAPVVQRFLEQQIRSYQGKGEWQDFVVSTMNPAGIGSVRGVQVEQLDVPYRLGKITASRKETIFLRTTNIAAFTITDRFYSCKGLQIDNDPFPDLIGGKKSILFVKDKGTNRWKVMGDTYRLSASGRRTRSTYGPIHRMYESSRPLIITVPSMMDNSAFNHAGLQIAHDWYLYGRGDAQIVPDDHPAFELSSSPDDIYYRIYLGLPSQNKETDRLLSFRSGDIVLSKDRIRVGHREFTEPGTGILFLWKGIHSNEIAIIVAGLDAVGFDLAWRLLPKRTGMMIPEWIVIGKESKQKGLGGILGAGMAQDDPTSSIPVVDFSLFESDPKKCGQIVFEAAKNVGFFYLRNFGIEKDRVQKLFDLSQSFFALPMEEKLKYVNAKDNLGYLPLNQEKVDVDSNALEEKESFHFQKQRGQHLPALLDEHAEEIHQFIRDCHALSLKVTMCLALGLEIPEDQGGERWFSDRHAFEAESRDVLRILHYPPCASAEDADTIRIGAHSDYGSVTILFQKGVGGLEIQKNQEDDSEWIEAPAIPDTVIVNLGDCLGYWTNGLLRSTRHRVVFKPETRAQPRYSMAFFLQGGNIPLDPIPSPFVSNQFQGEIITAAQHLENKLKASRGDPY
ncbi:hypothetical protein EC973_009610 [Apophysomyces ossiformis]|uniref:Fe2OG dioxygenase domain-containing protein n=1 Tax=Apophysomyces ossiformis TaxID=679940 RepID=A0A8H7BLB5_9FUNG|nr:hypothetical protein EC973_009610 [Apophysomyces ossiformis]